MAEMVETRGRILDAATEEFAAHGFAGARVDAIARSAGCNKQLIYHYFGNKSGLYEAVAMKALTARQPNFATSQAEIGEGLARLLDEVPGRRAWWRLMLWEALEGGDGPVVGEAQRSAGMARNVEEVAHAQRHGFLDPGFPPRLLLLALIGLILVPFLVPQVARLVTGMSPYDATFRREYRELLERLLERLGPR